MANKKKSQKKSKHLSDLNLLREIKDEIPRLEEIPADRSPGYMLDGESLIYLSVENLTTSLRFLDRFKSLQILHLASSAVTTPLLKICSRLKGLRELMISRTRLTNLPPEIGNLINLTRLVLTRNTITTLPPEIRFLTKLRTLSISRATFMTLPPEIQYLSALQTLKLSLIDLTVLPPEIGYLSRLKSLNLSGSHLIRLLPEICYLSNLRYLNLANTPIMTLPPEIGQLTTLQSLNLSETNMFALPPEIARLTKLLILDMPSSIPRSIQQMLLTFEGRQHYGNQLYYELLEGIVEKIKLNVPLDEMDRNSQLHARFASLLEPICKEYQTATAREVEWLIESARIPVNSEFHVLL